MVCDARGRKAGSVLRVTTQGVVIALKSQLQRQVTFLERETSNEMSLISFGVRSQAKSER